MSPSVRRALLALVNEGVDALSNLLLAVWVARSVLVSEFGAFAVAYALLPIGILASLAFGSTPLLIRASGEAESGGADHADASASMGAAGVIGALLAGVYLVIGLLAGPTLREVSFAFAAVSVFIVLQDSYVYLFYQRRSPVRALVNNLIWLAVQVSAFAVAVLSVSSPPAWVWVVLWGGAAGVAVVASTVMSRAWPSPVAGVRWMVRHLDLSRGLAAEEIARQGAQQSVIWLVARFLDLAAVGTFKVAQVALGVPRLVVQGIAPLILAEAARLYRTDPHRLPRILTLAGLGNCVLVLLGAGALYLLPDRVGEALFGDSWADAALIILIYGVASAGVAVSIPYQLGLKSMEATDVTARARTVLALATPVATVPGLIAGDLVLTVAGVALIGVVDAIVLRRLFYARFRASVG